MNRLLEDLLKVMTLERLELDLFRGHAVESRAPLLRRCEPATRRGYDGLDPYEQHDPHTGRPYSTDLAHYRPLCPAH